MEVIFTVTYHVDVVKEDIPKLTASWKRRIRISIEEKLTTAPETFGKPLRQSLKGYRRLRVGDYRIIFRIEKKTIKVFVIQHRSIVYKSVKERI